MSIEAIRQVTETEQANKQSRAAAEAEARQLVLDAERNGTELLKQVRSDAAEQGKDLLRQAEERAALRADQRYGVDATALVWLNRLSDYFYLLGRTLTAHYRVEETLWIP